MNTPSPDQEAEADALAIRRMAERINDAYIKWLHGEHVWVPGAAGLAHDAYTSGYVDGYEAAAADHTRALKEPPDQERTN